MNLLVNKIMLGAYGLFLLILFVYSVNSFLLLLYYRRRRNLSPKETGVLDFKPVTIQLPIYNEMYVAERLIDAVCEIDYPRNLLEIQVLDDSDDETRNIIDKIVRRKKNAGYNICVIRRGNRTGYKAGALKNGLKTATGHYIAIFDADFIPAPDFLLRTLKFFSSEKIGMVQTRWGHLNENFSLLTRLQALALNGHFVIEQTVRNRKGFFINFNGTGGVWRKECILDAGNWHEDTVAEDVDLSYRAQLKGWSFVYLNNYTTQAELPVEMNALKTQQYRWTKGTVQAARKLLPQLWRSNETLEKKLQGTFHLTSSFVFPFILMLGIFTLPMVMLKSLHIFNDYFNFLSFFIISLFASFFFYLYAQKEIYSDWKKKILLFPIFLIGSMGFSINNTKAVLEGLFSNNNEFIRTPKFNIKQKSDSFFDKKYLTDMKKSSMLFYEFFLSIYSLASIILAVFLREYSAIPFAAMYFLGFTIIFYLSFKGNFIQKRWRKG